MVSQRANYVYAIESIVHGHHVYERIWMPHVGKKLQLKCEDTNDSDQHAHVTINCMRKCIVF